MSILIYMKMVTSMIHMFIVDLHSSLDLHLADYNSVVETESQ
jgi:hypothetical protein